MRLPPLITISIGLVSLTVITMMLGNTFLQVVPDERERVLTYRRTLSEALAIQYSTLASYNDFETIEIAMNELVERTPDILSAALVSATGETLTATSHHESLWTPPENNESTLDHVQVPIYQDLAIWGILQIRFQAHSVSQPTTFITLPWVPFIIFVALLGFLEYYFFMKRTWRHLEPSSVIPQRVQAALDNLEEGVVILDTRDHIILANRAFLSQTGKEISAILGTKLTDLMWLTTEEYLKEKTPWELARIQNRPQTGVPRVLVVSQGLLRKLLINCSPMTNEYREVTGMLVSFNDVTELDQANAQLVSALHSLKETQTEIMKKNEELERRATRDPLTGCFNRRAFFEQFEQAFIAARANSATLSCIMTDIDHFKLFNDRYGHALGDQVIQVVIKTMSKCIRPTDVIGRYGGEEFCVILPGADRTVAMTIAEHMRQKIELESGAKVRNTSGIRITSSFGVASISSDLVDPAELVDHADKALYGAKEGGRNQVGFWNHRQGIAELPYSPVAVP
ncbi:sensor domain-containing diguanylate cyclase [Candidatus Nitrospira salsa]